MSLKKDIKRLHYGEQAQGENLHNKHKKRYIIGILVSIYVCLNVALAVLVFSMYFSEDKPFINDYSGIADNSDQLNGQDNEESSIQGTDKLPQNVPNLDNTADQRKSEDKPFISDDSSITDNSDQLTNQDSEESSAQVTDQLHQDAPSLDTTDDHQKIDQLDKLGNEELAPQIIKLLPQDVLDFYYAEDYPDDDYSVSYLERSIYPYRADIPIPFKVTWDTNENAMRTMVSIDTNEIGTVYNRTMLTYEVTGLESYPIYNLLPATTYYYQVTHVLSDGSILEAKRGKFTTSSESIRLIYIDGTQNVRDLGGWTGLDDKKVKYGKIFRGASLSDSSFQELMLTGKGKRALSELKIQAELNLGAFDQETSIGANCSYKKIGYSNYAIAITNEYSRAQFKETLEYIVSCLDGTLSEPGLATVERNIYIHCQGGCDRTGTLSFLLLGLLGVSESDLAKEYELSNFSRIGVGRLRTTTKKVNTYDYVGMVEAIKEYSGDTITEKFYDFATTGCGISEETIAAFRSLMLE